jgi:hypothetical protein
MTPRAGLGAVCVAALTASGCAFTGIDLVQDTRLTLQSPKDGATVTLPVTVSWRANEQIAPGHDVSYAVFVDKAPVRSGHTLRDVVPSRDKSCKRDPACPDLDYLARHDVYVVTAPRVRVPRVPDAGEKRQAHRIIVIVLVDGRRDGEGAFSRTVYVEGAR